MIRITDSKITPEELKTLLDEEGFGDMVKVVVDIVKRVAAVGGALHADAEQLLLERGSRQQDLWGANLYPFLKPEARIEYSALINIRPGMDNGSMIIQSPEIRNRVKQVIETVILGSDEELV